MDDVGPVAMRALPLPEDEPDHHQPKTISSAPPPDGFSYLRAVRRQANTLPDVVRVDPPLMPSATPASRPARYVAPPPPPPTPPALLPSPRWEEALLSDFRCLRAQVEAVAACAPSVHVEPLPRIGNPAAWERFCTERPPLISSVARLDQRGALQVLATLHAAILERDALPSTWARWTFALLVRLECALPAEDAATLRSLLVWLTAARARLPLDERGEPLGDAARGEAARLSTLLCVLGRYFGQAGPVDQSKEADDSAPPF